tara:strand:+ start:122 stop:610 length:489 start_codon:yes stop_codon:yes gene_type:complete
MPASVPQIISINQGYSWISFNVRPNTTNTSIILTDGGLTGTYNVEDQQGINAPIMTENAKYIIQSDANQILTVNGPPTTLPLSLTIQANTWTWIPCPYQSSQNLTTVTFSVGFTDGDVIRSQTQFSEFYQGSWIGQLILFEPGLGYQIRTSLSGNLEYPFIQ